MLIRSLLVLALLVLNVCFCSIGTCSINQRNTTNSAISLNDSNTITNCIDSTELPKYKPIEASWTCISHLISYCMSKRLNLDQGQYKHNRTKTDSDFGSRVEWAEYAKDCSSIDDCANFSMVNDTIFFIESYQISMPFVRIFLWDKENNVIIKGKSREHTILLNKKYQSQFEYFAMSTLYEMYFKDYPELKKKIEIWDLSFLAAVKRSPKVKNESPSYVIRVIIQNGYITSCEWIIIETIYKPDASLIIE